MGQQNFPNLRFCVLPQEHGCNIASPLQLQDILLGLVFSKFQKFTYAPRQVAIVLKVKANFPLGLLTGDFIVNHILIIERSLDQGIADKNRAQARAGRI